MPNTKEKLIDILRKTRYEYRHYIGMKDMEKRMAKTEEEFLSIDDSILGEIPFCADYLLANGVTVQEWISVKDRLPEDDEVVLIACKIGKMFVGYHKHLFPGCEVWRILTARDSTKKITYTVTHWMPLPEPPKEDRP